MNFSEILNVLELCGFTYLGLGLLYSPFFLWNRIGKVDPAALNVSNWFRVMILPGVVLLWPVFAFALNRNIESRELRWRAQGPILITLILVTGVLVFFATIKREPLIYTEPPKAMTGK